MSTEVILAIIGIVAIPLTSWITSKLLKAEYKAKIDKLTAEVETIKSANNTVNVENTQKLIDLIMTSVVTPLKQELEETRSLYQKTIKEVVEPLKRELNAVRKELSKFRLAVQRIPECPHSDNCPVKRELREQEADDNAQNQ
ncbi:MAG: hypothetical protein IKU05_05465 [Bacteroidales bacterium]|nr:hypothetical protein [Bacteroidales bacterium]MBR6438052.1 hypothetical protein [Bacteroidales bacterium]